MTHRIMVYSCLSEKRHCSNIMMRQKDGRGRRQTPIRANHMSLSLASHSLSRIPLNSKEYRFVYIFISSHIPVLPFLPQQCRYYYSGRWHFGEYSFLQQLSKKFNFVHCV